jgi:phage terminase large subunit GpA-like protein
VVRAAKTLPSEKHIEWLQRISYPAYLRTPHWSEVRRGAIERSKLRCGHCGKKVEHASDLDVHHKRHRYETRGRESPEDVIALCRPCHRELHPHWRDTRLTRAEWRRRWEEARLEAGITEEYTMDGQFIPEPAEEFDLWEWWRRQVGEWEDNWPSGA